MSVDKLQEKIRKTKNPSVVDLTLSEMQIPPCLREEEGSFPKAYDRYCRELLAGLKGLIPAVRFSFSAFALMGAAGMDMMKQLMACAKSMGFYVLLDTPESLSLERAEMMADVVMALECDGVILSAYIGTDSLKPYVRKLKDSGKSLFAVIRTANKTASELQDLMTGSRLVHMAAADKVKRLGEPFVGRCGYSQVAGVGAASSASSLQALRSKYPAMFLLLDGYDYPNSNAKNCSYAFDRLGHGAIACAGSSITAAWMEAGGQENDYVALAVQAALRMKKNLTRYVTVL